MTLEEAVEDVKERLEELYLENYDIRDTPQVQALKKAIKTLEVKKNDE